MSGLRLVGVFQYRSMVLVDDPIPLIGHIAFGVIDRGTNVIQVRPFTGCPHACIFCSVDAGPTSRNRQTEYIVEPRWLVKWVRGIVELKGPGIHVLLDGVGEPLSHPRIIEIIKAIRSIEGVESIAVETHGGFLSEKLVDRLERAGLDRINLSIDAVEPSIARELVGAPWYDPTRILKVAEYTLEKTRIDVVLTPVVVPGYNEGEMVKLVEWAREHGAGEKSGWPTGVLIQKYEVHRWGRKPRGVKPWSWKRFYNYLRDLEAKTGYRLIVEPWEIGFRRTRALEKPYRVGEKIKLEVIGPGLRKGELLAVDKSWLRVFTLIGRIEGLSPMTTVTARILRDKDNIYLAQY
ncbi:MAG: radical SAM protein [Desulfurococcales archaeon]|nr:radical SAM protein [Desulfurococcales archaeon]